MHTLNRSEIRSRASLRLLQALGRPASRTEIMRLLFLVDLELARKGLRPLFRWVRWHYGPFSRDVLDVLDELEDEGLVSVDKEVDWWSLELKKAIYTSPPEAPRPYLNPAVEEVVEREASEWRDKSLDELLRYVYSLPVVRGRKLGEEIKL